MNLHIKHITIISLLAVLGSCSEISVEENSCTGLLGTPVFDVDLSVDVFTATKADAPSRPVLSLPETGEFNIKVVDKEGNPVWDKKGFWSEPLKMPVGTYTVEATYGSNTTFGEPFYFASCSVTISALEKATPALKAKLKNALLAVYLSDGLEEHFSASEGNPVKIAVSGEETTFACGLNNYVYVPAGKEFDVTVDGKASTGVAKTLRWNLEARSEGTATCVSCGMTSASAPVITMGKNADDYGAWGTVAYIPFASTQNINAENAAKMEYLASSDGINFIKGDIVEGVNVKFTGLTTGTKYSFCAKVGNIVSDIKELTVAPMPSIVVTATGTTSYDYYLAYKKNGDSSKLKKANDAAPETVSEIGYSVSGIDEKLKEPKFGYSETLEYDGSTVQQNTTKEEQPWGKHTVSATVTFAGQTFNGSKDCHVTGLPASYTTRTTYSNAGWKGNPSNNTTSTYSFYNGDYLTSPSYYFPDNTNIAVEIKISPSAGTSGSFSCNGASQNFSSSGGTFTYNLSMSGQSTITINANISGSSARYCKLNSTNIKYR